jgi:tetratricopeptide (TPR) repeat protein
MRIRLALALSLAALVGCGGGAGRAGGARSPGERGGPSATIAVTDDAFAESVRALLAAPPGSAERANRLAGVEARQMERAATRFKAKSTKRAVASVLGGLKLLRTGELVDAGMLGPSGPDALRGAAKELSARGDEGRAQAIFEIWSRVAKPEEKPEIQQHLDALALWMKDAVARGGPVVSTGGLERAAVARRLIEPSAQARDAAIDRTIGWIDKAYELLARAQRPRSQEELIEVVRAKETSGAVLASIYLLDGDARGALAGIQKAHAQELVSDDLVAALKQVAGDPSAEKWLDLVHALRPPSEDGRSSWDDEEIVRAGAFGAALEAYRVAPSEPEAAAAVVAALDEYGMQEACPLVLVDAVRAHPDPRVVEFAMKVTMRAMQSSIEGGEPDAARRAYRAAKGLLDVGSDPAISAKTHPSAWNVRAMMGEIEMREGRLADARALFAESLKGERAGSVLLQLARIDRHDKKVPQALEELRDALAAKDATSDPALRGEILLETSDLVRQQGDTRAARTPLTDALKELNAARNAADPDDRARVQRVLARVLDRFGATKHAERALERAYEAAPHDKVQAAATVGQIVARAFVRGDLAAARDGVARGLAADLDDDDMVYSALWLRLLEKQMKAPTDGSADRIFTRALDDAGWIGQLARFGAGLAKAQDLVNAAKTPAEKTEALFYTAMDRRVAGDTNAANVQLRSVVDSNGIDLMEVAIARDILDGPRATVSGPIPAEAAQP